MGRREKPLDPAAGPVEAFAHELRALRRAAGSPTYRAMAEDTPYSAPTLSGAASGERLPSLPVTLAFVRACGGDEAAWTERRLKAAADGSATTPDDGTGAPYPGLARYGTEDRAHFFGREELVADLLELTRHHPVAALVGASGSGKSSLLRAGLVPAVQEDPATDAAVIRILTPGPAPFRTHQALLTPGALLLVDQFEEVFTLCRDPAERDAFIGLLTGPGRRAVLAVRADFSGRCAEHPALAAALKESVLLVGAMTPEQLRAAVVGPATAERLIVERELTARIVADAAGEPGGLPLLSHALLETWRRRRGRTLTAEAYEAIGGMRGAVAHTAEEVFTALGPHERQAARALLLRLISPGDATEDTRRSAARAELPPGPAAGHVLERLVRARLLTVDDGTVDLAHEALIRGWPRLRGWIERDRDRLRLHRRLTDAARTWDRLGRDEGALYRGAQLAAAREAFAPFPDGTAEDRAHPGSTRRTLPVDGGPDGAAIPLTDGERDFLTASLRADDDRLRAAQRAARRLRLLTAALSALLCLTAVAGLVIQRQNTVAERRAVESEARRIAETARSVRASDPRTALRLGLAAWRLAELPETRRALFEAADQPLTDRFDLPEIPADLEPHENDDNSSWPVLSADGRTVSVVGPDRVARWDAATRARLPDLPGLGAAADRMLAIDPDARRVAYGNRDGVRIWDTAAGRPTGGPFGPRGSHQEGWFGPGGRLYVSYRPGAGLTLWDTRTGRRLLAVPGKQTPVRLVTLSADDGLLAFCPSGGRLQLWDTGSGRRLATPGASGICAAESLVPAPDGRSFAVSTEGGVRVWDARTGRTLHRIPARGSATTAFGSDGTLLATLDSAGVGLWRLTTGAPPRPLLRVPRGAMNLAELRIDPDTGALRSLEYQPSLTLWTFAYDRAAAQGPGAAPLGRAAYSPDGTRLVTHRAGAYRVRDAADGRVLAVLPGPGGAVGCGECVPMAFSPDGRHFGYADASGRLTVRDLVTGVSRSAPAPPSFDGGLSVGAGGTEIRASRSGPGHKSVDRLRLPERGGSGSRGWSTLLAGVHGPVLGTTPEDAVLTGRRTLIEPRTGRARTVLPGAGHAHAVAFGPDGAHTALTGADGRVTLWRSGGRAPLAELAPADPAAAFRGRPPAPAFSPDSRWVALADTAGRITVRDTAAPRSPGLVVTTGRAPVLALAFSPDGGELRVTTAHSVHRAHSLDPARAAAVVCARSGGGLGEEEWRTHLPHLPHRKTCP
ncbi:hypothetical protein [Streptomyces clavuligerus]|uniref:nSTAND1 domain-containing NTPase n=1 Tax=Streptomyces clavuligerus TaxID=1901 RepID=UPI0023799860|nr:hypothetical protein [Streptomyces clavuligerus]WDN56682.1 hypothetical protein LL058_33235 [Streptomyces clavuligerus]